MKICPKCQQQFPNGFQYCPNDTEYLITNEEHVRRTRPMASTPAAGVGRTTSRERSSDRQGPAGSYRASGSYQARRSET